MILAVERGLFEDSVDVSVVLPPEPEATGGQKEEEDIGYDKRIPKSLACALRIIARLGSPPNFFLIVVGCMLQ